VCELFDELLHVLPFVALLLVLLWVLLTTCLLTTLSVSTHCDGIDSDLGDDEKYAADANSVFDTVAAEDALPLSMAARPGRSVFIVV
jgi:hypothetical protein